MLKWGSVGLETSAQMYAISIFIKRSVSPTAVVDLEWGQSLARGTLLRFFHAIQ